MAITVTQRGTVNTNADADPISIASVALTVDRVYIGVIATSIASGDAPSVSTMSGTGLSMTKRTTTGSSEIFASRRVELWYGKCTESGTVTISADLSATSTSSDFTIYELDGVDTTGTNGANAIVQAICKTNGGTSTTSIQFNLAAFAGSSNRPFAFMLHRANEATTHDSGGGYTELLDANHNNPSAGFCVQWHSTSNDQDPDFSWTTSSQNGGIAVELAIVAGNVTVEVPAAALTTTGSAPRIDLGVVPPNASLTTTSFEPTIGHGIIVPNASLALTTFEPTVTTSGGGSVEIVVPAASLTTTTSEPRIDLGIVVPATNLATTTFEPTIGLDVVVPDASLTVTTFIPRIDLGVIPETATLALSTFEPTVTTTSSVEIVVPNAVLSLTTFAPTVTSTTPRPVVTVGVWSSVVTFSPGDEWSLSFTGPAADAPRVRLNLHCS